jgi:hypothetical protein
MTPEQRKEYYIKNREARLAYIRMRLTKRYWRGVEKIQTGFRDRRNIIKNIILKTKSA